MYIVGTKAMYNDRKLYIKNLDLVIETESSDAEMVSLRKLLDEENKSSYEIQDIYKNKYTASKDGMELFYEWYVGNPNSFLNTSLGLEIKYLEQKRDKYINNLV